MLVYRGVVTFSCLEDSSWNILDFIVVAISVFDVAIDILPPGEVFVHAGS